MSADITGNGSMFSHFTSGRFALCYVGHWALIILRPRGVFQLRAVEPALDGFPNTELGGGAVGVYKGSKHPKEALLFMEFLGSPPFNRLIVKQADSLPPVPKYAETEEYLHPAGRENEWLLPKPFADAARETGITVSKSPFVLQSIVFRVEEEMYQAMIAGRMTPEQSAKAMGDRINAEIQLTIGRDPKMKQLYDERVKIQQQIEARRAAGQPVQTEWITDAFHQAYYRAQGWLEKEAKP